MSEYQPSRKASRVGQTKTVGNKSYRLNENHRWELIDTDTSKNLDVTPRAGSGYSNQHTPSDPDYLPVPVGSKVKLKTVRSGQSDIELKYLGSNAGRHLLEYPDGTKRYFNSGDVEKPAASAEPSKPAAAASSAAPKAEAKPNSELLEKSKKAAQHSKTLLGHMGASAEKIHANLMEQSKGSGKLTPEAHMKYAKAHDALADSHFNEAQKLEGDAWMFTAAGSKDYSAEHEQAGLNHRAVADAHRKATNGYYD